MKVFIHDHVFSTTMRIADNHTNKGEQFLLLFFNALPLACPTRKRVKMCACVRAGWRAGWRDCVRACIYVCRYIFFYLFLSFCFVSFLWRNVVGFLWVSRGEKRVQNVRFKSPSSIRFFFRVILFSF